MAEAVDAGKEGCRCTGWGLISRVLMVLWVFWNRFRRCSGARRLSIGHMRRGTGYSWVNVIGSMCLDQGISGGSAAARGWSRSDTAPRSRARRSEVACSGTERQQWRTFTASPGQAHTCNSSPVPSPGQWAFMTKLRHTVLPTSDLNHTKWCQIRVDSCAVCVSYCFYSSTRVWFAMYHKKFTELYAKQKCHCTWVHIKIKYHWTIVMRDAPISHQAWNPLR